MNEEQTNNSTYEHLRPLPREWMLHRNEEGFKGVCMLSCVFVPSFMHPCIMVHYSFTFCRRLHKQQSSKAKNSDPPEKMYDKILNLLSPTDEAALYTNTKLEASQHVIVPGSQASAFALQNSCTTQLAKASMS